jgi:hypothetical protein
MSHRTENCGIKCFLCAGLGHSEDRCWKKPKDGKSHSGATNFVEVLLNEEEATLQQLNKLCGNEKVFSYIRVPKRRMPVEVAPTGSAPSPEAAREATGVNRENSVRSKILSHFIKGKISITPMEIVLMIPGELEHLESLVKLARRKKDAEATNNQVSMVSAAPTVATLTWPSVGVKPNTWKSWGFGVLRDSRMFRARQQGAKTPHIGVLLVSLERS